VSKSNGSDTDLFFAEGTTPTEGAMWRERFHKRMEERERRKKAREAEINRRRSTGDVNAGTVKGRNGGGGAGVIDNEDEEEADRRAQADDEEVSQLSTVA